MRRMAPWGAGPERRVPRKLLAGLGVAGALLAAGPVSAAETAAPVPGASVAPLTAGLTTAIARQSNLEGRVMWMDGSANLQRLSTREGVSEVMERCKQANINTVVVDVKPLSGHVLYNSRIAPRLQEWKGFRYPEGYDLLFTTMLEARRRGIRVYAALNIFSEGHKLLRTGPLYEKRDQQAIVYDVVRTVEAPDGATRELAQAVNQGPAQDQVAAYDPEWTEPKTLGPSDAAVLVTGDRVTAVVDGSLAEMGSVTVPKDGHLLVGRGAGRDWLLEHLAVGQHLKYTARDVLQPILESPNELVGGFVNPADPKARAYAISLIEEVANTYAVDGIVFDRMRYSSLRTDFSPLSRAKFEEWLGKKVERFPHDIYAYDPVPGRAVVPGPYFKQWLEWRARTVSDWLEEARQAALRRRSNLNFGVYVGSWYPSYYGVGVNWGAPDYRPGLEWMSDKYPETGYAAKLHWLSTGCYYPVPTRDAARQLGLPEDRTVEAAAQQSVEAVNDEAFVYAGLYVLDYKGRPDEFRRALQAAVQNSQGVMLFDLVYIEEYNWWNLLSEAFSTPRRAPHDVTGLQPAIRQTKQALRPATQ